AGNGRVLLATNVKKKVSGQTYYFRKYPDGYLAPHIIGYSTQSRSRAGLERSENDYLTGANGSLSSVASRELDKLKGITVKGNDRQRRVQARLDVRRPRLLRGVRAARLERGQPREPRDVRHRHARAGAAALDQLRLLQHRQAHRRGEDPRVREALRLLRHPRP